MEFYKIINKHLADQYGLNLTTLKPNFRIKQNFRSYTEKRYGEFTKVDAHGNYLSTEVGLKEVPKYNYLPEGHWVLERLFENINVELIERLEYEPVWHFNFPDGSYQQPTIKTVDFIVNMIRLGPKAMPSEKELEDKEVKMFYEMLGGDPTEADMISMGSGVSMVGLDAPALIKANDNVDTD